MPAANRGFTLIEALVALVILSSVFAVVWGWFGTATISTLKIERAVQLPAVFDSAMERLRLQPFKDVQKGTYSIDDFTVEWTAKPNRRSTDEAFRRQPAWIVTLFDVTLEIKQNQKTVSTITTQLVKQWPDPNYIDPLAL